METVSSTFSLKSLSVRRNVIKKVGPRKALRNFAISSLIEERFFFKFLFTHAEKFNLEYKHRVTGYALVAHGTVSQVRRNNNLVF